MPAGMTWSRYLKFAVSALASMLLGASVVHNYYKPKLVSVKVNTIAVSVMFQ